MEEGQASEFALHIESVTVLESAFMHKAFGKPNKLQLLQVLCEEIKVKTSLDNQSTGEQK